MLRRIVVFAALLFVSQRAAIAKDTPEARTQALLEAFKSVKTADEAPLADADKAANEAAFKALDDYFDYDRLTGDTITPANRKIMSGEQYKTFTQTLREIIRLEAYPRSGAFLKDAKVDVKKGKAQGKRADIDMHAALPDQSAETNVTFHWEDEGAAWRLVDVSFDGASLVKDNQNQFGRIIKKDGADGLLKKVTNKLAEDRKAQG